jgi:hypothetical protein
MILTKEVELLINKNNLFFYKNSGYDVEIGKTILIPVSKLSKGSHLKIKVKCDFCELLKYFLKIKKPNRIISYANKDWSNGNLYEQIGFNKVHETNSDYKYIVKSRRIHKSSFRKSKTGISENNLNIPKIWDCGKIKYELIIKELYI